MNLQDLVSTRKRLENEISRHMEVLAEAQRKYAKVCEAELLLRQSMVTPGKREYRKLSSEELLKHREAIRCILLGYTPQYEGITTDDWLLSEDIRKQHNIVPGVIPNYAAKCFRIKFKGSYLTSTLLDIPVKCTHFTDPRDASAVLEQIIEATTDS